MQQSTRAATRFAPLAPQDMSEQQQALAQALIDSPRGGVRGPFHALMRNPRLAERVLALGDCIRFENSLPADLREFVILHVARHLSARYEWHAHSKLAAELGVSQDIIDAIGNGRHPAGMSPDQELLHAFCQELLNNNDVADTTYARALARFGEPTLLDVVCTVAYFSFVSMILNTVRYPVPDGGAQLPERTTAAA